MQTKIKKSFICREVVDFKINSTINRTYIPQAGDVALFKVLSLGKHIRMQCEDEQNRMILVGDLLLLAFGNRYATNQIEGYVPTRPRRHYDMLAQGGVVGVVKTLFKPLENVGSTKLELVGYAVNTEGGLINTKYLNQKPFEFTGNKPFDTQVILSLGTSMDSGKTTTAAYLCRGLAQAGRKVAYMKLTGTAFGKDADLALDCGAHATIDFSHVGFPSTYMCEKGELLSLYANLLVRLRAYRPEVVVIEIADGLLQRETNMLLTDKSFMKTVNGIVFSAGDSMGALYGLDYFSKLNLKPLALCGLFTQSPLLVREVQDYTNIPVLLLNELEQADVAEHILESTEGVQVLNNNTKKEYHALAA